MSRILDNRFLLYRSSDTWSERGGHYMLATCVSALVTSGLLVLAVSVVRPTGFSILLGQLPIMIIVGWFVIVLTALPGFIVTVTIASFGSIRHPAYFVICGSLTAISALVGLEYVMGGKMEFTFASLLSINTLWQGGPVFLGGAAGGYRYWRSAVQ